MKQGYFLTLGRKSFFLTTDATRKSPATVKAMIELICKYRGIPQDQIEKIKEDERSYRQVSYDMEAATIEEKITNNEPWYSIMGKNFGGGYDIEEVFVG